MNSTYVPVYTPHTTSPLAAQLGWGIGSALGWIPYNIDVMDELHPAEILTNGSLKDSITGWLKANTLTASSNGEYTTLSKAATDARATLSQDIISKVKRNTQYELSVEVFVESFQGTPDSNTSIMLRTVPYADRPSVTVDLTKIGVWQNLVATGITRDDTFTAAMAYIALGNQEMRLRVRNFNLREVGAKPTYVQPQQLSENAIQVTLGFDLQGEIGLQFPEFFLDCYIDDDKVAKIRERVKEVSFDIESNQAIETHLEGIDPQLSRSSNGAAGTFTWTVSSEANLEDFVFDNGWMYFSAVVPAASTLPDLILTVKATPKFLFDPVYDTKPRTFRYNGLKQPYYLFVRDVNRSVLPAVNNLLTPYSRGTRNYNYGKNYGVRQISLNCFIKANQEEDIPYLIEDLARFLDVGETTIRFSDAKDRSWKVVLDGSTDISQSLNVGDFTITFSCIEVNSYGEEVTGSETFSGDMNGIMQIHNEGTAETYPIMKINFEEDSPMINIVGMGQSENITLGYDSADADGEETNFNPRPLVIQEKFDNMNSLTPMNNLTTPDWLFNRKFVRNTTLTTSGGNLILTNNKFPKIDTGQIGFAFYGGGVVRTLPKALDDFTLELAFTNSGLPKYWTNQHQFLILYDDQGIPFMNVAFGYVPVEKRIRFNMATMGSSSTPEVRANAGKPAKDWYNFVGKIVLERKDNRWRLQGGKFKSKQGSPMKGSDLQYGTTMLSNIHSSGFRQFPQETWSRKVAAIGILYANLGNRPQINRWAIDNMNVWENLTKPPTSTQTTLSFEKGDELLVDFPKSQVWLNGTPSPAYVQPSTDWFSLKSGKNTLGVSGLTGTLEYEYINRYK